MRTIFFVYSLLFTFSFGDQRYRKNTFAKDYLLSNYYYNEAFISEYKGESAATCGQFCINFNCFSFTFDPVKGTCRLHRRRMTEGHSGQKADNTTYYYGEGKWCSLGTLTMTSSNVQDDVLDIFASDPDDSPYFSGFEALDKTERENMSEVADTDNIQVTLPLQTQRSETNVRGVKTKVVRGKKSSTRGSHSGICTRSKILKNTKSPKSVTASKKLHDINLSDLRKQLGLNKLEDTLSTLTKAVVNLSSNPSSDKGASFQNSTDDNNGVDDIVHTWSDAKDCSEIEADGFFTIYPQPTKPLDVYCNKGWTVIQNRFDGSVNFYRGWNDYKHFFGNKDGEYWLGHENIRMLTSLGLKQLRIDVTTADSLSYQATYMSFSIEDEANNYRLHVKQYSGNAGDSLSFHDGMAFSTFDRDNDGTSVNCAGTYTGAWWYGKRPGTKCFHSTLNALYGASNWSRMIWYGITANVDITKTSMKIRRP